MIHTLACYRLPRDQPFRRDLPPRAENPAHMGWRRYDDRTLVYEAVAMPGRVRLYLPRTFNLWELIAGAEMRIDGRPVVAPRRKIFRRFETLDLPWAGVAPTEATLDSPTLGKVVLPVASGQAAPYAGRRVVYTMLRNERLDWVRDWLFFHQREHGADAALITNNGSTDYTSADLLATMRSVPGYVTSQVLDVPLPWGPFQFEKGVDDAKFLQTTLLNLVRDRFFSGAAGVLNLDIDELVIRRKHLTAYEIAMRWGYATFRGNWHYTPAADHPRHHADHVLINRDEKLCPTKYVYVPGSRLGRCCLSVHSLEKIGRNFFKTDALNFIHCWGISTSWKIDRSAAERPGLTVDPEAEAAFTRTFSLRARNDAPAEAPSPRTVRDSGPRPLTP
jgi:hypothetical protein